MLPSDSLFKKRICAWSEHFIRSEPKTALFGSRPLKESSGRAQILAEKGDWRGLLALLIARGENRLFSPEKSGRFVFAEPAFALSAKRTVTILVFRLRRKTATEQKEIAFGRRRCAGASSLFMSFRELQKNILVIFYTLFGAIRGSRAANHDL